MRTVHTQRTAAHTRVRVRRAMPWTQHAAEWAREPVGFRDVREERAVGPEGQVCDFRRLLTRWALPRMW